MERILVSYTLKHIWKFLVSWDTRKHWICSQHLKLLSLLEYRRREYYRSFTPKFQELNTRPLFLKTLYTLPTVLGWLGLDLIWKLSSCVLASMILENTTMLTQIGSSNTALFTWKTCTIGRKSRYACFSKWHTHVSKNQQLSN